jgi:nitroreductase
VGPDAEPNGSAADGVQSHPGPSVGAEDECLDVIDAIFTTRAMRRLRPDPVPQQILWKILDAAIRGPSSGNVQRWAWIVVTDPDVKSEVAGWYLDAWNALERGRRERLRRLLGRVVPPLQQADESQQAAEPDPNRAAGDHLANHLAAAPVWVIAAQQGVVGEPGLVDGADIFGAVQNLMLAARKYGLGSTLTMLHRRREADVARLLGFPRDVVTVALIPIGYPERAFSTPRRRPVEEVVHWERWGAHRDRPTQDQ